MPSRRLPSFRLHLNPLSLTEKTGCPAHESSCPAARFYFMPTIAVPFNVPPPLFPLELGTFSSLLKPHVLQKNKRNHNFTASPR